MNYFLKVFLLVFLLIVSYSKAYTKTQSNIITKEIQIENNFNYGNYDNCIKLLHTISVHYEYERDFKNVCKTWTIISVLENLLNRKLEAEAALKIAKSCTDKSKLNYLELADVFNSNIKAKYKNIKTPNYNTKYSKGIINKIYWLIVFENYRFQTLQECNEILKKFQYLKTDSLWYGYKKFLYELGVSYYYNNSYTDATKYFQRVINLSKQLNQIDHDCLNAYSYILKSYNYLDDYQKFNSVYLDLNNLKNENKIKDINIDNYYIIKGTYYYLKKNFTEAYNAYSLVLNKNKKSDFDPFSLNGLLSTCFYMQDYKKVVEFSNLNKHKPLPFFQIMIAYSYLKIGDKSTAIKLEKSINKDLLIKNNLDRPTILFWLASFYAEIQDFKSAEFYYTIFLNKTLSFFGKNHIVTSQAYNYIAYFYWVYKNNIPKALDYYQRSLSILIQDLNQTDVLDLPDISKSLNNDDLAICLRNKGEAFLELSKTAISRDEQIKLLQACIDNFNLAFKALNKYKFALLTEEKKLNYSNTTRHFYSYVIEACSKLYEITGEKKYANKAFEYVESSKASLLLSMIKGTGAKKLNMVPEHISELENYIRNNTEKYTQLIDEENNKPIINYSKIDIYNDNLLYLNRKQDSLLDILTKKYPVYYNLKYGGIVSNIDTIQKKLPPDHVLIEYSLSGNSLYIFLISKQTYKVVKETVNSDFYTQIENYRKCITSFDFVDTKDNAIYKYADLSFGLYNKLLAPVETLIKDKIIIIIPDDILNTIPFEPMVTKKVTKVKEINYRDLPYLVNHHQVIYDYSASLMSLENTIHEPVVYNNKLLAIAPISTNFTLNNIYNENINRDSNAIAPIPGTINEVKNIHRLFGGKLLLGKKASEKRLKLLSDQFDIIHIASHGFVNNNYPLYSRLILSPDNDSINDGLLNTYEIYGMHISAPLVVLSACNTGYGKLYKGEGTISLARGFYIAGAKNILMTLWAITDKTSNKLVQQFYKQLAQGETVTKSIQQAKIKYIREADEISAHPFFWAGYISIGNPDIKFKKPHKSSVKILISIGILSLLLFIGYKILNKKSGFK